MVRAMQVVDKVSSIRDKEEEEEEEEEWMVFEYLWKMVLMSLTHYLKMSM